MAVTSTQSKAPASANNVAIGRYLDTGAAAAFTITVGFQPRYVRVVNLGATGLASIEWFEGMAAASGLVIDTAGIHTVDTTTGITVSATGFTLAVNTDVNVANEQLSWIAIG